MTSDEFKQQLTIVTERLTSDIASLRTGRATPALVEDLEIDYFGSKTALKAMAAISSPEPRLLVIQPWDKSALPAIEKAIASSGLGMNPIAQKDVIRLAIPALTEERRKDLAKKLGTYLEESRIQVRQYREETLREIDRAAKEKKIGEDEKFRRRQEVQKITDDYNEKIQHMGAIKEKEILNV